jgi:putative transcriptional regulator
MIRTGESGVGHHGEGLVPHHHVPADSLAAYAAGATTPGEDLLIACHLTLCPACREVVDRAEQLGDELLTRVPSVPLQTDVLATLLGKLDQPESPPPPLPRCDVFPAPLRRHIGPLDSVPWRSIGGDLRVAPIDLGESEQRVFLMDFPARFRIPTHGHQGLERAMVLRGAFTDERTSFDRGDVSWREEGDHQVVIDPVGRCTTLFVNDGPADLGPVLTKLVDWWITGTKS